MKDNVDLKFLYENHSEFSPLPTYFISPGLMLLFSTNLVTKALTHTEFNLSQLLHGEQYLEVFDDLPTEGSLRTVGKVVDVCDKKSGAVIHTQCKYFTSFRQLFQLIAFSCFQSQATLSTTAENYSLEISLPALSLALETLAGRVKQATMWCRPFRHPIELRTLSSSCPQASIKLHFTGELLQNNEIARGSF